MSDEAPPTFKLSEQARSAFAEGLVDPEADLSAFETRTCGTLILGRRCTRPLGHRDDHHVNLLDPPLDGFNTADLERMLVWYGEVGHRMPVADFDIARRLRAAISATPT